MAELYGCNSSTILNYAKSIGYKQKSSGLLNEEQKREIVDLYYSKTSSELADIYGVTRGQITKIWYDNNLKGKDTHTYPFNYDYFENIDTEDKAYFLGFIAADGNVFKRKDGNSQSIIRLSLQEQDKTILEIFKIYLNSQQPLHISKHENNRKDTYTLELVSDKTAHDLKKYNIVPQKTYDYELVKLDQQYMSHFFRGYFDGDGSINCSNNKFHTPSQYNISISGFEHNLMNMKKFLFENENIHSSITIDNREYGKSKLPFGSLVFLNINDKYKFLNYIYNNKSDIYLSRKRYLAECFINAINKNYSNKQNLYNNICNAVLSETNK